MSVCPPAFGDDVVINAVLYAACDESMEQKQ